MESLDLSGVSKKSDGPLKSLLWPTVDNAWDVDYLGQQGFWICLLIGLLSLVFIALMSSALGGPVARTIGLGVGLLTFFVFFVGGMGVREASWPAAAIVFGLFALNVLLGGGPPGVISIIIGAVLLSNLRATVLASKWKPVSEDEDRPTRFNETFKDKLVDQWPPRLWPVLRIPFFVMSGLLVMFLLFSLVMAAGHKSAT